MAYFYVEGVGNTNNKTLSTTENKENPYIVDTAEHLSLLLKLINIINVSK